MATTTKFIRIKLHLDDGKTSIINLPTPINNELLHPTSSTDLVPGVYRTIAPVFETDDGAHIDTFDVAVISTTTNLIAELYKTV